MADKPRCQALDVNGKQCRKNAVRSVEYNGDAEDKPSWVRVCFCLNHLASYTAPNVPPEVAKSVFKRGQAASPPVAAAEGDAGV